MGLLVRPRRQEGITPGSCVTNILLSTAISTAGLRSTLTTLGAPAPLQTEIVQAIFKRVDENGYIKEDEIEAIYCEHDQRFLADRYVVGCPAALRRGVTSVTSVVPLRPHRPHQPQVWYLW